MATSAHVFERLLNAGVRSKARFCRRLVRQLDPTCPPQNSQPKVFLWQYRALRERVAVYEQYLDSENEPAGTSGRALHKAEQALDNSLHYFKTILAPDADEYEEDDDS
jgi:hypothetical protein